MSSLQPKDYLGTENARNKKHAELYTRIIRKAIGSCDVLVGHHLTFEIGGDLSTENEIPSADTLLFDHDIMGAVFGDKAFLVMQSLAIMPADRRDELLAAFCKDFNI